MAGALTRDQEKAVFAKLSERPDVQRIRLMQRQNGIHIKGGGGSIPTVTTHEKIALIRDFKNIKKNAQDIVSTKQAEKDQKALAEKTRKDALEKLENKIKKETALRHQFADKKITYEQYQEELKKLNPATQAERKVLPKEDADQKKARLERENYYQDIKNPNPIFPEGSQSGVLRYNPVTKAYYVSHAMTAEEQRRLGVEKPVGEGFVNGYETLKIDVPLDKQSPYEERKRPTKQSEEERKATEAELRRVESIPAPDSLGVGEQLQESLTG